MGAHTRVPSSISMGLEEKRKIPEYLRRDSKELTRKEIILVRKKAKCRDV